MPFAPGVDIVARHVVFGGTKVAANAEHNQEAQIGQKGTKPLLFPIQPKKPTSTANCQRFGHWKIGECSPPLLPSLAWQIRHGSVALRMGLACTRRLSARSVPTGCCPSNRLISSGAASSGDHPAFGVPLNLVPPASSRNALALPAPFACRCCTFMAQMPAKSQWGIRGWMERIGWDGRGDEGMLSCSPSKFVLHPSPSRWLVVG